MHRADPYTSRPPPRRRGRRDSPSRVGPAYTILESPPDQAPAPLLPHRTRVTIREIPRPAPRRPGIWIGTYRIRALDVIAVLLAVAVLTAIYWPH